MLADMRLVGVICGLSDVVSGTAGVQLRKLGRSTIVILTAVGFKFKGTYDRSKVISRQSCIRVYYDDYGELAYILADLCFTDGTIQTFLDVTMYDASVDLHQKPN